MTDAGVGSPPAKSKAKGQSAAAAADASSPAASDIRTGTVNVPGSGTLTVSQDTPGVAKDENGRTVRLAKHLADYALASPKGSGADAGSDAGSAAESAIHLDLQPELQQAAMEATEERAKDKEKKKAAKAAQKKNKELIGVEDIQQGAAKLFRSDPDQLVLLEHPVSVHLLEISKTMFEKVMEDITTKVVTEGNVKYIKALLLDRGATYPDVLPFWDPTNVNRLFDEEHGYMTFTREQKYSFVAQMERAAGITKKRMALVAVSDS